jgi:hypothetical protein
MNRTSLFASVFGLTAFLAIGALPGCASPVDDGAEASADGAEAADGADGELTGTSADALSYSANLVNNGFFESAIYGWNDTDPSHGIFGHWHYDNRYDYPMVTDPNASVKRTTAAMWGGTYGVRIKADGAGSWADMTQYTPKKITGGAKYRIWVATRRVSGASEQCVDASFIDASGQVTGAPIDQLRKDVRVVLAPVGASTTWHAYAKTFTAPKDAVYVAVGFGKCHPSDAASVYDWDSFSLRKVL